MQTNVDSSFFTCSITLEHAYQPMVTPCGHLFDRPAIEQWLVSNVVCPVCRSFLLPDTLIRLPFLESAFEKAGIVRPVERPDLFVVDDVPDLIPAPILPPILEMSDVSDSDEDMLDIVSDLPSRLMVDLSVQLINPRSSNYGLLLRHVSIDNRRFVDTNRLAGVQSEISRYVYHSRGNITEVMRRAVNNGYLVYDLFRLTPNRYMLYSVAYRINATIHHLDTYASFRNMQRRLN